MRVLGCRASSQDVAEWTVNQALGLCCTVCPHISPGGLTGGGAGEGPSGIRLFLNERGCCLFGLCDICYIYWFESLQFYFFSHYK